MSKKLNRTTDEAAESELQRISTNLAKRTGKPYASVPADARLNYASIVSSMHLNLAAFKYQLDYPNQEIVHDLASGAHWKAAEVEVVVLGGPTKTSVWSLFMHSVALLAAFGSDEDRVKLSALPSDRITGTPDADSPGCVVARLWNESLRTGTFNRKELTDELARCEAGNADRWDRQWTHGILRSLIAIVDRNQDELQAGLEEIARFTEHEALRGDWQTSHEGRLSLVGLGICRVARDLGLEPVIDSIYIPLGLLEGAA